MISVNRVGGFCIIIGAIASMLVASFLDPGLDPYARLASNAGLPSSSVNTGFGIFEVQWILTVTWSAPGLLGAFLLAKGKKSGVLLAWIAGFLGIAGAFIPLFSADMIFSWNIGGITYGYTIASGATLYLSGPFWYGAVVMVAGGFLMLVGKEEWAPAWIRQHVSRAWKIFRRARSAAARDKTRAIVIASMVFSIAATGAVNVRLHEAWLSRFPVYSYPTPPPGVAWIRVEQGPTPVTNPLKGFIPYAQGGLTFPHTMEFSYSPLRSLAGNSTGVFNFTSLDKLLDQIAGRGHQAVLRVYLDSPNTPIGTPQYLIDEGVEMRNYTEEGGGTMPNYDDPRVVAELLSFIHAFGNKYDGDPRIGFIQAGLLGKWGEWHTSPQNSWFANETTQRAVLQAYNDAFKTTWIQTRYPNSVTQDYRVGFHDDVFAAGTLPDDLNPVRDYFWEQMTSMGMTDIWQRAPIGGELSPPYQVAVFQSPQQHGADFNECVYTTHASWLLNSAVFHTDAPWWNMSDSDIERAKNGSRLLGYDMRACWVNYTYAASSKNLTVTVVVANFGVAPFYYNWTAHFGVFDQYGSLVREYNVTSASILGILPGNYTIWHKTLGGVLPSDTGGSIAIRVPNVLTTGSPVVFSNKEILPGNWTVLCGLRLA